MTIRTDGYLTVMEISYSEKWEVGEITHNAYTELKAAIKTSYVGLFNKMTPDRRMQQLEIYLFRYSKVRRDAT